MSKKVKIKETTTIKQPVVMKEAPKVIMECGKGNQFVIDIRPKGTIISFPDESVTKEQVIICFEKIIEQLKKCERSEVCIFWQEYYDSGDAEDLYWN